MPGRTKDSTLAESLREAQGDPAFRRAWADLRETCAGAKTDLADLLAQYVAAGRPEGSPVAAAMERVFAFLTDFERGASPELPEVPPVFDALAEGLERHFERPLSTPGLRILDPCGGTGEVVEAILRRIEPTERARKLAHDLFANEPRLPAYLLAAQRLGAFEGLCFAHSLALPERGPTPGFDFSGDENAERLRRQRDSEMDAIVGDLRSAVPGRVRQLRETYGEAKGVVPSYVRWATDRLRGADGAARDGIVAFVSDGAFVDEPSFALMRASLEREFDRIEQDAELGLTFLIRRTSIRTRAARIFYNGRELEPTPTHVWRTEILREEWSGFMPLAGGRSIFAEGFEGIAPGQDTMAPAGKARRAARRPFVEVWRRVPKGSMPPPEGLALTTLDEPFGAFVSMAPLDARLKGRGFPFRVGARENVTPWAMARFRAAFGPGVTERDVFDYTVALLHHRSYLRRYHEDLRRGLPRVPLLDLDDFADDEGAPPVGPGTAYGTGWTASGFFEEGTVPEYDDPFASPYARADVEPGFLLFAGLGAALVHLHTHLRQVRRSPLERIATEGKIGAMRLSKDRTRLILSPVLTLGGIPEAAFDYRVGRKSALEWVVEGMHPRADFAPDEEAVIRLVEQTVAMSLEANRLIEIVSQAELPEKPDVQ